jgi:thiosulfate reductase cytochrome b subunit
MRVHRVAGMVGRHVIVEVHVHERRSQDCTLDGQRCAERDQFTGQLSHSSGYHVAVQPAVVRVTHWVNALGVLGLVVSGIAILLAHPRLYWGETGTLGTASLIDLPLPFIFGHSGWGRSLHFASAWLCVLSGMVYVLTALTTRHFEQEFATYSVARRLAYAVVVFLLFPMMIWTGLAMSPAVTSVFPVTVTAIGGQQTARTVHFMVATLLVVFVAGHVFKVWASSRAAR